MKNIQLMLYGFILFLCGCWGTPSTKSKVIIKNNEVQLRFADVSVSILPEYGGRISQLKCGDVNLLMDDHNGNYAFGSTFWIAPQSLWDWPPPPVLDSMPYSFLDLKEFIHLKSDLDTSLGISITKFIYLEQSDTSIHIRYTIHNETDSMLQIAPWEISRIPKDGMTFFPKGEMPPTLKRGGLVVPFELNNDLYVYRNSPTDTISEHQIMIANGSENWSAFVYQDVLWIKQFEDISLAEQAKGEGEILHYVSPILPFQEFEIQGRYTQVEPQTSFDWDVVWYLRKVKAGLDVKDYGKIARTIVNKN